MHPVQTQARRVRADAARNRSQILEVAREAYEKDGIDVSLDRIAKAAGVGPGTLYRHFPTRDALLAALLLGERYDALLRARDTLTEDADAGHALDQWVLQLGRWMSAYDGLPEPLRMAWLRPDSPLGPTCRTLEQATAQLLLAAQRAHQARASISARDLFLLALAIAWAGGASAADDQTRQSLHAVLRAGWRQDPEEYVPPAERPPA